MQRLALQTVHLYALYVAIVMPLWATPLLTHALDSTRNDLQDTWDWQIPQELNDTNTKISFEVDSTWHLVKGTTSGVHGNVWLANRNDPLSIRAQIRLPVARFDTGGESRDARMREVMDEEHAKHVTVMIDSFTPGCTPKALRAQHPCPTTLQARLAIRGIEREISLPGDLRRNETGLDFSGTARFSWLDFGVEDPSIFVAKLDPDMSVTYSVRLPLAQRENIKP